MARTRWTYYTCSKGQIALVGRADHGHAPYLRIEDADGNYVDSVDGAALKHLRNALTQAISAPEGQDSK